MFKLFIIAWPFLISFSAFSDSDFKYFDKGIDYWGKEKNVKKEDKKETSKPKVSDQKKEKEKPFNWSKYLDPKNDEFFKEGNYTPPAPFMELARDPSDRNIKNWIAYNSLKNQLSTRLKKRMQEYLMKKEGIKDREKAISLFQKKAKKLKETSIDSSRYRIRMFFDSNCPHCKRMFDTLLKLQNAGIYVEALQVDKGKFKTPQFPIPVRPASSKEIKQHKINSVPFTLIADLKKKVLYPPLKGYQETRTILNLLKEAQKF